MVLRNTFIVRGGWLRAVHERLVAKHASWRNMVGIEIGVLNQRHLERRMADRDTLRREVADWQRRRNGQDARVRWMFDVCRALEQLRRVCPTPVSAEFGKAA